MADAQVLELCLSSKAKPSVKHSSVVVTRRALRRFFAKNTAVGKDAIKNVISHLTAKSQSLGVKSACFLGVVAGVCARLPTGRAVLQAYKDHYYSYYLREVIGSRAIVPQHLASAFADFFSHFTTSEDLHVIIAPAFERALLRAPEVALDLLPPMVQSISLEIDLAKFLADHLFKPLLSNIKSQNLDTRNGAVSAFSALIRRSHNEFYLKRITDDILTPLLITKVASADQRAIHARLLALIPLSPSLSKAACEKLAIVISKELNETALCAEVIALTHFFSSIILVDLDTASSGSTSIIDVYVKGLSDRRPSIRRIWAIRTGDIIWSSVGQSINPMTTQFIEAILPKVLEDFDEVVLNPQHAGNSGLSIIAYFVTALSKFLLNAVQTEKLRSLIMKAKVHDRALSISPKPSFLLNHRLYTKITDHEEHIWIVRALEACSGDLFKAGQAVPATDAWVQALLFFMTAAELPFTVQKQAAKVVTNAYLRQPVLISNIVVQGLWNWYRSIENAEKDSAAAAARTGNNKAYLAVHSICLPPSDQRLNASNIEAEALQAQLINMLVLCRPEILPNTNWIELCLRVGQDPGALVQCMGVQCLERIESCRRSGPLENSSPIVKLAANNAAVDLAFVAPDKILPLLLESIEGDLRAEDVRKYGPTEAAISRMPEGTAFIDVLSKDKRNLTLDKNSRDYDTIRWEEDVRNQVAQKKGQEKKLTPDEKARVNAQLLKEFAIRKDVKKLESRLNRGIGLVNALATGPPTGTDTWVGRSLKALLAIIAAGAGYVVGSAADEAYLACATVVSSRLGALRQFIGVATLRALGFSTLPAHLEEEPLPGEKVILSTASKRLTK